MLCNFSVMTLHYKKQYLADETTVTCVCLDLSCDVFFVFSLWLRLDNLTLMPLFRCQGRFHTCSEPINSQQVCLPVALGGKHSCSCSFHTVKLKQPFLDYKQHTNILSFTPWPPFLNISTPWQAKNISSCCSNKGCNMHLAFLGKSKDHFRNLKW